MPSDDSHDIGFKFPFYSSEILSCDNPKILEMFLKNENNKGKEENDTNFERGSFGPLEEFKNDKIENFNDISDEKKENNENLEENKIEEVKKVEIIKIEEKIENKEENPHLFKNDLLDYFLSFLDNKSELNYVLCGYFAKFFNVIFTKNSAFVKNKKIKIRC